MSKAAVEAINNALNAHDQDSDFWLARIKTLLKDPDNAPHHKALEVTQAYLESFSRSTPAQPKRRPKSIQ